ncbi:putative amino acid/polyamine transporter 2 [Helianthus debilis subsp. tardiflorus]
MIGLVSRPDVLSYHNPLRFSASCHQIPRLHHQCHYNNASFPTTPLTLINFRRLSSQQQPQPPPNDEEIQFQRLFSNLNRSTLQREPGSVTGSVLLVAGTTVGAGILAIPAVTQESGFLAAAVTCILCWIYMVVTGLLIAEVNVKTMCELGSGGVSLVSMATRTLGAVGVQIACWSYIFIHYALLVAYVARSSDILTDILGIPVWECASLFSLLFGSICYFGSQQLIGAVNGVLVLGIIISFAALVAAAGGDLHWDALLETNLQAIPASIPIIALSFVYQPIVGAFSLLAIATSYIGFVLGLSDFLSDLLKLPSDKNRPLPYILTVFPPLILSLLDPDIFFKALDFAGTYGVLVLFGVLPAAMAWSDRYSSSSLSSNIPELVPGGRFTLSLVIGGAGYVIVSELLDSFMHK